MTLFVRLAYIRCHDSVLMRIVGMPHEWGTCIVISVVIQHPQYTQGAPAGIERIMDEQRIHKISAEMSDLLEQQKKLLNVGKSLTEIEPESVRRKKQAPPRPVQGIDRGLITLGAFADVPVFHPTDA